MYDPQVSFFVINNKITSNYPPELKMHWGLREKVRRKWKKLFDSSDLARNNYQLPGLKLPKLFFGHKRDRN